MSVFQASGAEHSKDPQFLSPAMRRFTKKPFEIVEKVATICGKSTNLRPTKTMATACKHPRVRIVSRHEDTEFVECLECGDVFDADEFHDMAIEESAKQEDESQDE